MEKCVRCGETDQDRRTLWMACMYAMDETGLPFKQLAIHGRVLGHLGKETLPGLQIEIDKFEEPDSDAKGRRHPFYTLRVCKRCRADWMVAIKGWFESRDIPDVDSIAEELAARPGLHTLDGKVPVRVFGATVSVPQKENLDE